MKLKKVFAIITLIMVVFVVGCKKEDEPGIPPTVKSTVPMNDALSTVIGSDISATFSTNMNPLSITSISFTLKMGTDNISGTVGYSDSTATFNPEENMVPNTLYTATITTGVKDISGTTMLKNYTWSFTTGELPDNILPTVTLSDPLNDATGVSINKLVAVTFSELMDPASISDLTFTLKQGTTAVAGSVAYSGTTATFTPASNLAYSSVYTGTVTTGAKDLAGNALAVNHTFNFTTGATPDITFPVISLTDPLNNAIDVALTKVLTVTFSESMTASTINGTTFRLMKGTTSVPGTVAYSGMTATFTPTNALTTGSTYSATITTGAKDLAGNALASNTVWSFSTIATPDVTAPVINSTDPLNNATDVALAKVLAITFSESMTASTINGTTFTLKQGATSVPGTVAYSGMTATFTPTNDLSLGTSYTATITTGAEDLAGNALAANTVLNFSTVTIPDIILPVVTLTDPLNNATGIALAKVLAITFSESMTASTITSTTFTLKQGTTSIPGIVAYSGMTATFTPTNALLAGVTYTATITTGAEDLAGNALAVNTVWDFTTISQPVGQAVVNLGTAGNYVILAKTAINNVPTSAITGDLGLSPAATSYITGFGLTDATGYATSPQVTGQVFAADMVTPTSINLTTAVENMLTAYTDAAGRPNPDFLELGTGNLGGKTLMAGLYKFTTSVTLPTDVTISGSADDVWIFQISGDLSVSNAVNLTLIGGAKPENIFWQVAGEVVIGTTAHFEGIILSMTGITLKTGASFKGRALAQTAVILDSNAVIVP